jgi:hypothetical protein
MSLEKQLKEEKPARNQAEKEQKELCTIGCKPILS